MSAEAVAAIASTRVTPRGTSVALQASPLAAITVTQCTTGLTGRSGTGTALISADADNQLTEGSDQRLFVPPAQSAGDPLAYYILASN